jgi:hypothetical protein
MPQIRWWARIHSIHTAAAYAPYSFANGVKEDIFEKEAIEIEGGTYRCVVDADRPATGDGLTFLSVERTGENWQLQYEFAGGVVGTLPAPKSASSSF